MFFSSRCFEQLSRLQGMMMAMTEQRDARGCPSNTIYFRFKLLRGHSGDTRHFLLERAKQNGKGKPLMMYCCLYSQFRSISSSYLSYVDGDECLFYMCR